MTEKLSVSPVSAFLGAAAPAPFGPQDAALLAGLPFLFAMSWLSGEAAWHAIARQAAAGADAVLARSPKDLAARIAAVTEGARLALPPAEIVRELAAGDIVSTFQVARAHRPGGWTPEIAVEGEEHLQAALARGRGAVLWDSHFHYASLITKMGLAARGHGLHHLSRREHGFSASAFGMAVLNPIRTAIEKRYLKERLVMPAADPGSVLAVLADRLRANAVVSITVRGSARRPIAAPFFARRLPLAPGAPVLAFNADAPLIPVFTLGMEPGRYRVVLDAPLDLPRALPRAAAAAAAAHAYARRLQAVVCEYPGQWMDWAAV